MKSKKIFVWIAVIAIIISLLWPLFMVVTGWVQDEANNNPTSITSTWNKSN